MPATLMYNLAKGDSLEKQQLRHLRVELMFDNGPDISEFFFHNYRHEIPNFPKLERCDVLVTEGLRRWGYHLLDMYWGACLIDNVRMIDAKTGEWINGVTAGPYVDYLDTSYGSYPEYGYVRVDIHWDEKEDAEERYEAMMRMKGPLPRIDLNY